MANNFHNTSNVHFIDIWAVLLLSVILFFCVYPGKVFAEELKAVDVEELKKTCKGLKPYNNLDELLYQFYINLDSGCLFKMPKSELEKIWDTKILDKERAKPHNYYPLSETEFYNKAYKSEKDAFYIEYIEDDENGRMEEMCFI